MFRFIWRRLRPLVERMILELLMKEKEERAGQIREHETRISRLEGSLPGDPPSPPSEEV